MFLQGKNNLLMLGLLVGFTFLELSFRIALSGFNAELDYVNAINLKLDTNNLWTGTKLFLSLVDLSILPFET